MLPVLLTGKSPQIHPVRNERSRHFRKSARRVKPNLIDLQPDYWQSSPVPRHDEISLTAKRDLAERWKAIAVKIGFGERGRFKLLTVLLDFVEENTSLFRKR